VRILMLAPQPFFRARGTPISVRQRIHALADLGHSVDLITYPIGEPVEIEGLTIERAAPVPFVRDVPVGPSVAKIALDLSLLVHAVRHLRRGGYDLLHTHEEAAILGAWLSRRFGIPHLYDMHSSLPEQFGNFGRYDWSIVRGVFRRLERFTLARSDLLITICPALATHIVDTGYVGPHAMIENTYGLSVESAPAEDVNARRTALDLAEKTVVVYTGTLEAYQGLELLLQSWPLVVGRVPRAHLLIVGGTGGEMQQLWRLAEAYGVERAVTLLPAVPPQEVGLYHQLADVLVTCRTRGVNTPLKLYEYLRAGRPIVATAIHSHLQVLDEDCAELVLVEPSGIADGIVRVIEDPERAATLAQTASDYSEQRYNRVQYLGRLKALLSQMPGVGIEVVENAQEARPA
jgi:glycosyltransferase involved in cell wall biosynthesis